MDPLVDGTSFLGLSCALSETPRFSPLMLSEPLESAFTFVKDFFTDFEIPVCRVFIARLSATAESLLSVTASLLVDLFAAVLSVS